MSRQDVDKLWRHFTSVTRARIALGRAGDALPTRRLLDFAYAHASARDAVAARVDFDAIAEQLRPTASLRVRSAAPDRSTYLRRPDLGRMLAVNAGDALPRGPFDAVFVIADGLSASAVQEHAVPLLQAVQPLLSDWTLGPVVLAEQARVALGDEIGAGMGDVQPQAVGDGEARALADDHDHQARTHAGANLVAQGDPRLLGKDHRTQCPV
jgi:ethanolamine ammonia-lyase small subunit